MADARRLVEAFKKHVEDVELRMPGYHERLLEALGDVFDEEREFLYRHFNIAQRVQDIADVLGDDVAKHQGSEHIS